MNVLLAAFKAGESGLLPVCDCTFWIQFDRQPDELSHLRAAVQGQRGASASDGLPGNGDVPQRDPDNSHSE